jgi:hypothetical protein
MAQLALNNFKTVTAGITTTNQTVYTAPSGYTSVVLYAHITNVGDTSATFTISHQRSSTTTEIIKDRDVPVSDAFSPLDGKLVLETNDSIVISASEDDKLKLILSLLETANA